MKQNTNEPTLSDSLFKIKDQIENEAQKLESDIKKMMREFENRVGVKIVNLKHWKIDYSIERKK